MRAAMASDLRPMRLMEALSCDSGAERSGSDERKSDGPEVTVFSEPQCISNRAPNRAYRRTPEHVDPGDVNNRFEGQPAGRGEHGPAERNCAMPLHFSEWLRPGSLLDGRRDALRQKQPPRDGVSLSGTDDYVNVLFEQVAVDDFDLPGRAVRTRRHVDAIDAEFLLTDRRGLKQRYAHGKRDDVAFPALWALEKRHCPFQSFDFEQG